MPLHGRPVRQAPLSLRRHLGFRSRPEVLHECPRCEGVVESSRVRRESRCASIVRGPQYLLADHRPAPTCLPLFEVKDLKAKAKELRSRGWKSEGRSFEVPPGPCLLFKDPSGNQLALLEHVRPNVMGEGFED